MANKVSGLGIVETIKRRVKYVTDTANERNKSVFDNDYDGWDYSEDKRDFHNIIKRIKDKKCDDIDSFNWEVKRQVLSSSLFKRGGVSFIGNDNFYKNIKYVELEKKVINGKEKIVFPTEGLDGAIFLGSQGFSGNEDKPYRDLFTGENERRYFDGLFYIPNDSPNLIDHLVIMPILYSDILWLEREDAYDFSVFDTNCFVKQIIDGKEYGLLDIRSRFNPKLSLQERAQLGIQILGKHYDTENTSIGEDRVLWGIRNRVDCMLKKELYLKKCDEIASENTEYNANKLAKKYIQAYDEIVDATKFMTLDERVAFYADESKKIDDKTKEDSKTM